MVRKSNIVNKELGITLDILHWVLQSRDHNQQRGSYDLWQYEQGIWRLITD